MKADNKAINDKRLARNGYSFGKIGGNKFVNSAYTLTWRKTINEKSFDPTEAGSIG